MTYRQCQKLGGQVRKGERSTIAIFYKSYDKPVERDDGEDDTETRRVLKAYAVFNAHQCDGLPDMYRRKAAGRTGRSRWTRKASRQFFLANWRPSAPPGL